jgi:hypothetical protein
MVESDKVDGSAHEAAHAATDHTRHDLPLGSGDAARAAENARVGGRAELSVAAKAAACGCSAALLSDF